MQFPQVSGANLLRRKVTLPDDLQGEFNLLFVAFQQWQQAQVDSWLPWARQLEGSFPGLQYYELPIIRNLPFLSRTFINEGMRAGIPNQTSRQKTITLYLEKEAFRRSLDIPHEDSIWVLVVDRRGQVLWRTAGAYTSEKGETLADLLREHTASA